MGNVGSSDTPVKPGSQKQRSPNAQWPLKLSQAETEYEDFVRSVDVRYVGMLSDIQHGIYYVEEGNEAAAEISVVKKFEMKLAVQDFRHGDIKVRVHGNDLIVEARRDKRKKKGGMYIHSYCEIKRTFAIPEGVDRKQFTSTLSSGGVLEIEAPVCVAAEPAEEKQQVEVTEVEEAS